MEDREIRFKKTLDAPVEKVWQAWTDPEKIVHWWGPAGFSTTIIKMDVQPGEEWRLTLHGPDGKNYPNKAIFREVELHKKIVYEHFNPDFIATAIFEGKGDKTILEWALVFESVELYEIVVKTFKADEGLTQNVEKLENFLATTSL